MNTPLSAVHGSEWSSEWSVVAAAGASVESAFVPVSQVKDGLQSAPSAVTPVRDAAAFMTTPEHCVGSATKSEEALVETPTPAAAADEDTGDAADSVPTPLPGPSPELTMRSDFITPPPQILGGDDAPEPDEAASSGQQEMQPDEAPEASLQHQVLRHCLGIFNCVSDAMALLALRS